MKTGMAGLPGEGSPAFFMVSLLKRGDDATGINKYFRINSERNSVIVTKKY